MAGAQADQLVPYAARRIALGFAAALALAAAGAPAAGAGLARSTHRCASLSSRGYRASNVRAHLATCKQARRIIRKWIGRGFSSGAVEGPWTCAYAPGARNPDCIAGKNGFIRFKLSPRPRRSGG